MSCSLPCPSWAFRDEVQRLDILDLHHVPHLGDKGRDKQLHLLLGRTSTGVTAGEPALSQRRRFRVFFCGRGAGMPPQTRGVASARALEQYRHAMPRFGQQPIPLDPFHFDRTTVREIARLLAERLQQVDTYGGKCPTCGEAEARAFLAKVRHILTEMDARGTR
jgi:hypothetical protein